jgi:hypothetical protein
MKKRKATFYLSEVVLKKLSPYRTYKSLLVETALEYLLENLPKEKLFEVLFLSEDDEETKKEKLKNFLSGSGSRERKEPIGDEEKKDILDRYRELLE